MTLQSWMAPLLPHLPHHSAVPIVRSALANYFVDHDTFGVRRTLKTAGLLPSKSVDAVLEDTLHPIRGGDAYAVYRALMYVVRAEPQVFRTQRLGEEIPLSVWRRVREAYPEQSPRMLLRIWEQLTLENRRRVVKDARDGRFTLRGISPSAFESLVRVLHKRARSIAYNLRFLSRNDGGLTQEDFATNLVMHAVRGLREAEFMRGARCAPSEAYMRNYAVMSMTNHSASLIQKHQTLKRASIVRVEEGTTTKLPEYARTVLSLDRKSNVGPVVRGGAEDEDVSLAETIPVSTDTETIAYVRQVRAKLNARQKRVVDAYLHGTPDPAFEMWASRQNLRLIESTGATLLRALCTYHKVPLESLQHSFRDASASHGAL